MFVMFPRACHPLLFVTVVGWHHIEIVLFTTLVLFHDRSCKTALFANSSEKQCLINLVSNAL